MTWYSEQVKNCWIFKISSLDLFHKSKNDLPFADSLYERILNIHA